MFIRRKESQPNNNSLNIKANTLKAQEIEAVVYNAFVYKIKSPANLNSLSLEKQIETLIYNTINTYEAENKGKLLIDAYNDYKIQSKMEPRSTLESLRLGIEELRSEYFAHLLEHAENNYLHTAQEKMIFIFYRVYKLMPPIADKVYAWNVHHEHIINKLADNVLQLLMKEAEYASIVLKALDQARKAYIDRKLREAMLSKKTQDEINDLKEKYLIEVVKSSDEFISAIHELIKTLIRDSLEIYKNRLGYNIIHHLGLNHTPYEEDMSFIINKKLVQISIPHYKYFIANPANREHIAFLHDFKPIFVSLRLWRELINKLDDRHHAIKQAWKQVEELIIQLASNFDDRAYSLALKIFHSYSCSLKILKIHQVPEEDILRELATKGDAELANLLSSKLSALSARLNTIIQENHLPRANGTRLETKHLAIIAKLRDEIDNPRFFVIGVREPKTVHPRGEAEGLAVGKILRHLEDIVSKKSKSWRKLNDHLVRLANCSNKKSRNKALEVAKSLKSVLEIENNNQRIRALNALMKDKTNKLNEHRQFLFLSDAFRGKTKTYCLLQDFIATLNSKDDIVKLKDAPSVNEILAQRNVNSI